MNYKEKYILPVLFLLILLIGGYFRFVGINWDENYHLHPDERFLTMVESSISPVKNLGEYFDTQNSSLNPHNSGYGFFVYGTFPIILVRYIAGWFGWADYGHVFLFGRVLSGIFDLLSVIFVYLCAQHLYRNRWLGIIAAALISGTVLFIQQSHFFVVDSIANFFTVAAVYFAICIMKSDAIDTHRNHSKESLTTLIYGLKQLKYFILFGIALGLAAASKINTLVVASLLPMAVFLNDPAILHQKSKQKLIQRIRDVAIAALVSFVVFRFFQPYAFSGPGFLNILPNPKWIENLRELSFLSSGDSNYPPSLQWARRPLWFGLENMLFWGMGLPLGIASVVGFIWMGIRIYKGEWKDHLLIWLWTAVYFIWQSLRWNPTMRYFIPIYPTAIIIAAWGLVEVWKKRTLLVGSKIKINLRNYAYILILLIVFPTFLWAFAFTRIYTRPVTRVSASDWIYQNIKSAINLTGTNTSGSINIPLSLSHHYDLSIDHPLSIKFVPDTSGLLEAVSFDHVVDQFNHADGKVISLFISEDEDGTIVLASQRYSDSFQMGDDTRGNAHLVKFERPLSLQKGISYYLHLLNENDQIPLKLAGNISLSLASADTYTAQPIFSSAEMVDRNVVVLPFRPAFSAQIGQVELFRAINWSGSSGIKELSISIADSAEPEKDLTRVVISDQFTDRIDFRGSNYSGSLNHPITLEAGRSYLLKLKIVNGDGEIAIYGSQLANETSWDDALPLPMHGYNPFDSQSGIYQSDLNFEMYWDENPQKLGRFYSILSQADYVYMSSNRQWGSITQIPEKYPLSNKYYRDLIGCPEDKDIQWCFRLAEPGMFTGKLGFQLVKVFQSDPNIGFFRINTQFAEEAFTVYDHPKVLIFKKDGSFSMQKLKAAFSSVDLTKVINLTPKEANQSPGTLTMSTAMSSQQYTGGTWRDLFDPESILNSNQVLSVVVWYLLISVLGWVNYPILRLCLGGLHDKGYPIHKLAGLLLLALPVWLAGSIGIQVNRLLISMICFLGVSINWIVFRKFRKEISDELRKRIKYLIKVEIIALTFFLIFLLIRLGNPDLWHPYKGGEKPMDYSYFNAVLKSSIYPPYDPWYASGYLNYYYFGFVLAGIPVKWLGVNPSLAYNFILPSFFSFTAMGAFSIAWNAHLEFGKEKELKRINTKSIQKNSIIQLLSNPYIFSIFVAILLLIIGNLGTVRMFFHGFQRLASGGVPIERGSFLQRSLWTGQGIIQVLLGQKFNYYPGDWYWIPSRAIPGEAITEFPFFTFLYADPHAHLFSLPLTLMALLWTISVLLKKNNLSINRSEILSFLFGAMVIGALRVTNTWDFPVFLLIGISVIIYKTIASKSYELEEKKNWFSLIRTVLSALVKLLLLVIAFIAVCVFIYLPFSKWYGQAYNSIELWNGGHTPLASYLTHWGFFFFITASWWVWQLRSWLEETPLNVVRGWSKYKNVFIFIFVVFLVCFSWMVTRGVSIIWIVVPLLLLGLFILLNKKYQSDFQKLLNFMALIGWCLTLMVELIVLKGDIGRMNTVFKFYLQAWTLIAITAGCFLFLLLKDIHGKWLELPRKLWLLFFVTLFIGVLLYPLTATIDKVTDRMSGDVPLTLDGMDFMQNSVFPSNGVEMELNQDYQAIKWMQTNVEASPVIVEANVPEYQWGNRFTIYTGMPGVVGWNWHQRQQRAILPSNWVTDRIDEIEKFYITTNLDEALSFLRKYQIKYIIVGQLEKINYPGVGLQKFDEFNGIYWEKKYELGDTKIFSVIT